MADANDFTFCQVGIQIDEASLESPKSMPDVSSIRINDDSSNPASISQDSIQKSSSLDNAMSMEEETRDPSAVQVFETRPAKGKETEVMEQGTSGEFVNGSQGEKVALKKPLVRAKIFFEKGYSQMDWLKTTRTHPDLAGLRGKSNKRLISMAEVKEHKTEGSVWTVLRGRVYNISPYMKFHPGGIDMLMKAAGKDCTSLFNKYHAWVNAEFLLEKCLVGALDDSR